MEYTTKFDEINLICTIHVTGQHQRPKDSITLQKFARDFSETHNCQRFLFDFTQANTIGGTMDAYDAGTVPVDPEHNLIRTKFALLFNGDLTVHKFMEDVAVNRGYMVRVFNDYEQAIAWLMPNTQKDIQDGVTKEIS